MPTHTSICAATYINRQQLASPTGLFRGMIISSDQYAADKPCVLTRDGPTGLFDCSIGVKQGCPASPLLFSLYLDELEALIEASEEIDLHCRDIVGNPFVC